MSLKKAYDVMHSVQPVRAGIKQSLMPAAYIRSQDKCCSYFYAQHDTYEA